MDSSEKEGIYNVYFNEIPCYVTVQNRQLQVIDCNRVFKEHFGAKIGAYCWEICKGRMSKCRNCLVEKTFQTGEPKYGEESLVNIRGEKIPVYAMTSPIFDKTGKIERVLEISTDISEVKRIQKKLNKTRQSLRQIFEEVPCYITVQDSDLIIRSANRKFREDFGEAINTHCYEAYKHRDEPCLECPVATTFEDGRSIQSEEVVTSIGGEQFNVLVNTAPLRDQDGKITQVIEISTNITQIRQLQDQLTSLGLLVGSISHGIKGLASALDSGMYLMSSGLKLNDRERIDKGWGIVSRNVGRIRSMISDILYYAKDRDLQYEPVEINSFIDDIAKMMNSKAENFRVDFKTEFADSLGEFKVDPTAIRSALVNILENSFDACRKDLNKPAHHVKFNVYSEKNSQNIVFDVIDNGIGMDRETREKVFSLFFSSKGIEGTGLGLFIANKIISKHGGSIELETKPKEGARFRVTLPTKPIAGRQ
ncbi:MAG: PAS domain-containing protein [Deltaproteobacteria bacterium]|nr:PAS domain-containing protein [Deltaproteobacteria bacterium]